MERGSPLRHAVEVDDRGNGPPYMLRVQAPLANGRFE
jgi:hypothetical protein